MASTRSLRKPGKKRSDTRAADRDFHQRLPKRLDLNWVFCLEHERVVSNDWVVRYQNRFLQLQPTRRQGVAPRTRVRVEQARDGAPRVIFADQQIRFAEIAKPWPNEKAASAVGTQQRFVGGRTPAADHPWRRYPAVEKRAAEKQALTRDGLWK